MYQTATVVAYQVASGRIALRAEDGSFVLAEQTDASPVRTGLRLQGNMREFGEELWSEDGGSAQYAVFVLAWDLSEEGVNMEM